MINWQAELDALMQGTMRLTKSTEVQPLIPRRIATGQGRLDQTSSAEGSWLVSFMQYDLGYTNLEEKNLQPLDNPFGPRV